MLDLSKNEISALPIEISLISTLVVLDISSNRISSLPQGLGRLAALTQFELLDNPLPEAVLAVARQQSQAVLTYLRELDKSIKVFEAKLLLIGEGKVGKSSLLAALRGEPFVFDRPTTHNIVRREVSLAHPDSDQAHEIHLNAWDFGGQEVYRIINQFFYTPQALYLVLWNARYGPKQCDLEQWLRRISLRVGRTAKVIVVATYYTTDQRISRLDEDDLRRKYGDMIAGYW